MFLSRNFNYSSRLLSIATKIAVNQCLFTPFFNSYFFGMQAFLAGDNLVEVWERIKRTVPTSMVNSIKLWPIVTAINFTWVPIEVRSPPGSFWGPAGSHTNRVALEYSAFPETHFISLSEQAGNSMLTAAKVPKCLCRNYCRWLADVPVMVEQTGRGGRGQRAARWQDTTLGDQDDHGLEDFRP